MYQENITNLLQKMYGLIADKPDYMNESVILSNALQNLEQVESSNRDTFDLLDLALYISPIVSKDPAHQDLLEVVSRIITLEGQHLRSKQLSKFKGLYVIIDPEITNGRDPFLIAEAAVRGGAKILQLRDKLSDKGVILELAYKIQELCENTEAVLIVNDHADIARAVGSFGLHVGQTDLTVEASRAVLNIDQHIGRSNRELEQLEESQLLEIDHVAFGPMFSTNTKQIDREPQGIDRLKSARKVSGKPLVAIGGINIDNIGMVIDCSPEAICVTGAVGLAKNPESSALALSKRMGY